MDLGPGGGALEAALGRPGGRGRQGGEDQGKGEEGAPEPTRRGGGPQGRAAHGDSLSCLAAGSAKGGMGGAVAADTGGVVFGCGRSPLGLT